MEKISQNQLWEILLELRKLVALQKKKAQSYSILFIKGKCRVLEGIIKGDGDQKSIIISRNTFVNELCDSVCFMLDNNNTISQAGDSFLDDESTNFIKQYLPFCFCSDLANERNRSYTILHMAQSVDGKIATESGNSKWVSNQENLIHSHRLRALCDAILIGKNTLNCDSPMLNVRHVIGPNPVRVVIANTPCNFDNLKKSEGKIILFTSRKSSPVEGVEIITIPDISGFILSELILKELYKRNIYSLYIEGGAITASQFLKEHSIDKVQLFISPKIFGSGINSFQLPIIETVEKSVCFSNSSFIPMGNGVLFEGNIAYKETGK